MRSAPNKYPMQYLWQLSILSEYWQQTSAHWEHLWLMFYKISIIALLAIVFVFEAFFTMIMKHLSNKISKSNDSITKVKKWCAIQIKFWQVWYSTNGIASISILISFLDKNQTELKALILDYWQIICWALLHILQT